MDQHSIDTTIAIDLKEMALREGALESDTLVFIDQYESSVKGRRWESRGR